MNELKICLIRVWFKTAFSYFYKEQKKVTRKGTEKSTQKPWKMETMMKLSPEYRVMIGNVVSMVVAAPNNMGIGMLLAVDEADVDKTMEAITKAGEKCFVVGEVVEGEKGVELV